MDCFLVYHNTSTYKAWLKWDWKISMNLEEPISSGSASTTGLNLEEQISSGSASTTGLTWRNPVRVASPHRINLEEPVRVASPHRINLEEPGQGGQPT